MDADFFQSRAIDFSLISGKDFSADRRFQDAPTSVPQLTSELLFDEASFTILEQCSTVCLMQQKSTQLYFLWDAQAQQVLLKATDWAEAYRGWLYVLNSQRDTASLSEQALHDLVCQSQDHPCFGQLVYRQDRHFRGILTYLVQLSETLAMCWTPSSTQVLCQGRLTIETLGQRRHRLAKWTEPRSAASVADTLHRSIRGLHQRCDYSLYQFNSEHWARLVTSGQSSCHQKDELYAYWLNHPDSLEPRTPPSIWEENFDAQVLLLLAIAP